MSELQKALKYITPIDCSSDNYRNHPSAIDITILKEKLKQEKIEDKALYRSIISK